MMPPIILGKPVVGRLETLQYAAKRFNWPDCVIGISSYYAFWAWILARLTGKKVIYYCIDYYTYEIRQDFLDGFSIWLAAKLDHFLCKHVDMVWDISERINEGRYLLEKFILYRDYRPNVIGDIVDKKEFGTPSKVVPLSYPPEYFRNPKRPKKLPIFVGLIPYDKDLWPKETNWCGKGDLSILVLLDIINSYGLGVSLWRKNGNNYYGDPGKTKLYSACGLPVIMTDNTPYAEIIEKTQAGIVIPALGITKEKVQEAADKIFANYDFYKNNVKKTWEHIDADQVFKNLSILE